MKKTICCLAMAALLAGQNCIFTPPPSGSGINAVQPSGSPIPEIGENVSIQVISDSSVAANVIVRYLVGPVEVRRTELQVPPFAIPGVIGPDLAGGVEIQGTYATGGATPSVVLILGIDFVGGDVKEYHIPDPNEECPNDPNKLVSGQCGCGVPDTDTDHDGAADCNDNCPNSAIKVNPGLCGCDVAETDTDKDGAPDCTDECDTDPLKIVPGACGCDHPDTDADKNGTPDCNDSNPSSPPPITDCNGNHVPDDQDIANHDSIDCNENGIPDECETDCNENGRPDSYDIALGTSLRQLAGRVRPLGIAPIPGEGGGDGGGVGGGGSGGPVLIGGDDADDHGFFDTDLQLNMTGWLYIEEGFNNIGPSVRNGNSMVVCLGCNEGEAEDGFASGFDFSALHLTAGWSRLSITGADGISNFFNGESDININNTGILYMPTDENNVGGGITEAEMAVVNAHADAINTFVSCGGGLFAHDESHISNGWGWLTALLPGLVVNDGEEDCTVDTLHLSLAGAAAFPHLTDDIASQATPWHSWFSGEFGGLDVLITGPCPELEQLVDHPVVLGGSHVQIRPSIQLSPDTAANPVGTRHFLVAHVTTIGDVPIPNVTVTFKVTSGPNQGVISDPISTDQNGFAYFDYLGSSLIGIPAQCGPLTDQIVASFVDVCQQEQPSNAVTKTWFSSDCNGNGVPDECETDTDGDGTIDACESIDLLRIR